MSHMFSGEGQICGFVADTNGEFLVHKNLMHYFLSSLFSLQVTEATDTSKEVCSLLIRTAYRMNHNGEENQRTVKLLNEILQKLTSKV